MEIVSCHTISTTEDDTSPSNSMEVALKPEDLISLGINDLLTLSREVKDTIIKILKNDDVSTIAASPTKMCDSCCISISFSDEDLLLGSKIHNRPLYVSGYVREQKLNQILIDNGSAVNILSKSTMNQLGTYKHEQGTITTKKSNEGDALNGQENDEPMTQAKSEALESEKIAIPQKKVSNPHVLCYIPLSRRKKRESLFAECLKNLTVRSIEILKESFTLPLIKIDKGEAKRLENKGIEGFLSER
ncbi:ty3-gypsy retrotransposon protein [Cucumis melo var. makuwa]|uniref:Ty3-gypsy retrotransposon protein n=1 Tax=Cucumis melo var. makuwa TaxID=1194695 RepID=A0A5A7UA74_CUCMM|nr:ty3-gypsy retrotransposon protein [Cucumis melo var. makuwa]TYK02685.1 ty3-gypsy retrotransposon protein [Cucumis melo var. makuwa]